MKTKSASHLFDIYEDEEDAPNATRNDAEESEQDHPQNSAPASDFINPNQDHFSWEG